jgi:hypothetical protein
VYTEVDACFLKEYSVAVHAHPTSSGLLMARGQYIGLLAARNMKSLMRLFSDSLSTTHDDNAERDDHELREGKDLKGGNHVIFQGTITLFTLGDRKNPTKIRIRIAGNPTEIRTKQLPNPSPERYMNLARKSC